MARQKKVVTTNSLRGKSVPYLFVLPFLLSFLFFFLYPAIYSLVMSFMRYKGYGAMKFVAVHLSGHVEMPAEYPGILLL